MALWSIERGDDVLGAALVAIEPGVPDALHEDVLARRRRLPHRLLPQLLAQSADDGAALGATFARVVRIAVHPAARRDGLGHRLLSGIVRDTRGAVEAVGASFGETPATAAFWRTGGFTAFHRGHRLNPRSGRRALAVLRAGSTRTRRALDVAAAIHRDNASARRASAPGTPTDSTLLRRFARGERNLSDTRAALWRLALAREHERGRGPAPGGGHGPVPDGDDAASLLSAFRLDIPPSSKARDARLREHVGRHLEDADAEPSSD